MARQFQFGFNLLPDSDQFDNTGRTDEEVAASKIIAYSACVELLQSNGQLALLIKVAKEAADLEPLNIPERIAFTEYINRIRYAGVNTIIVSEHGDKLMLSLKIMYNPLVLNASGERLDGSSFTPVRDTVISFLKNLPFNGVFVNAFLIDALQRIEGVVIPHLVYAKYAYGDIAALPIDIQYQPYSGYLRIIEDSDLIITYEPQSPII